MKSSLEKFGRKLTMHKNDAKEKRDHQSSAHLDELVQASKDILDMRNCYDGLLSAAAAMTNSIYEFSESLHEMGACLLEKTTVDDAGESGKVLSTLGNIQSELVKIADTYRSCVILTITNPSESLLSELRTVEEMKLQCDEKREGYEYMMAQHKEKGKSKSGKVESSIAQKLQEAQDEYNEMARLCAFRVKSLKEGQCRSLLTQATRHHAAQLNFFRKGLKALEAVDPCIKVVAEKHRIDYQLSGLDDGEEVEGMSSYESTDDGELSFDYIEKKQVLHNVSTSSNPMEIDVPHLQVPMAQDREINVQIFGRQSRANSSYSAPIYPEKTGSSERPRERETQKFHSYVLPPPVDTKSPISTTPTSAPPQRNLFQTLQHERDIGNDNTSTSASTSNSKGMNSSMQLPAPLPGGAYYHDSKVAKRQAYSGPLPPTKPFSGNTASTSGPITSLRGVPLPSNKLVSRSVSPPPPLTSPKISELHELPRPPSKPNTLTSTLPPPHPFVVPRSFSMSSTSRTKLPQEAPSPPLTPILLSNIK